MPNEEWICDDRIYAPGGTLDQVKRMSDEEFEAFIKALKEKERQS